MRGMTNVVIPREDDSPKHRPGSAAAGALLLALGAAAPALAVDGAALALGSGDESNVARAELRWDWGADWLASPHWALGGYWTVGLGYWDADNEPGSEDIVEAGVTPVFRLSRETGGVSPFAELSVGVHVLSRSFLNDDRRFGTAFTFGDTVALGLAFGPRRAYELSYRFTHYSNASIKQPNDGINFHKLVLGWHWR